MKTRSPALQRILAIGFTTAAFATAFTPIALIAATGSTDEAASLTSLDSRAMRVALTGAVFAPESNRR